MEEEIQRSQNCQWRRKTVQLWRDKIDHLIEKLSPGMVNFAA